MKNVPDELLPLLRNRSGDLPTPGNSRWGKVARLTSGTAGNRTSLTFVQTDVISPTPIPIAVKIRFSTDGQTYAPEVPALFGGNMIVEMTETIDMKSGSFRESFTLAPGEGMPICATMACALTVSVKLDGEDTAIFVQVVAAPTTMIDCADVVGPGNTVQAGYTNMAIARFPAQTATPTLYLPLPTRAMFTIVNQSASNLFVSLASIVNITPGTEFATIVLPGSSAAAYSVLNFRGPISFQFDADDATGYGLVSEGSFS